MAPRTGQDPNHYEKVLCAEYSTRAAEKQGGLMDAKKTPIVWVEKPDGFKFASILHQIYCRENGLEYCGTYERREPA